jgi:hypothetical protein
MDLHQKGNLMPFKDLRFRRKSCIILDKICYKAFSAFASKGKKCLLQTIQELASMKKKKSNIEEQKLLQSLYRFPPMGKKSSAPTLAAVA